VDTVLLKRMYILVFIEHGIRQMHLGGVTAGPTGEWAAQQARNLALSLDQRFEDIRFLIRDRGSNFTASFDAVFQAAGTRILVSAVQAPRMNAICERLVGTLRREVLDRTLIRGEAHLRAVLTEYQTLTTRPGHTKASLSMSPAQIVTPPRHRDRHRHGTDPPKTRPGRPDQRIRGRRLTHRESAGQRTESCFRAAQVRRAMPSDRGGAFLRQE
jgi:transposase InsO family protein